MTREDWGWDFLAKTLARDLGQFNTAMDIFQQAYDIAKEVNHHGLPDDHAQMRSIDSIGLM